MTRHAARLVFLAITTLSFLFSTKSSVVAEEKYSIKPTPKTVAWGYYDAKTPSVLRIKSEDDWQVLWIRQQSDDSGPYIAVGLRHE